MNIIGIDQSKRSTAVVCLDEHEELVDFILINPPMDLDKEELINYVWTHLQKFLKDFPPDLIAIEGAAFSAGGSSSDLLWGLQWYIRTRIFVEYPGIPVGILTAATWRSKILPAVEQRAWKQDYGKIGLKLGVVDKLPPYVRESFEIYLEDNKNTINMSKGKQPGSKSKVYLDCMHDLADAWGIATHRIYLMNGKCKPPTKNATEKISVLKRRFPNACD